jgi:hypothetical protein
MKMKWLIVGLTILWNAASAAHAQTFRFDFGPEGSPVGEGFTAVSSATRYEAERGYGFVNGGGPDENREVADDLGRDFTLCEGATFQVDVATGEYEVWVLLGDYGAGINPPPFWFTPYTISVNGKEVVSAPQDWHNFFDDYVQKNYATDWQPGQSLWDKYMAKFDRVHRFSARSDGPLQIRFTGPCPLRSLAIFPTAEKAAMDEFLTATAKRRREQFNQAWTYAPFADETPEPPAADADRNRGFLLFRRYFMEDVRPESRPRAEEVGQPLTVFAARGEYEPVSFGVYPLADVPSVEITVSPLAGPKGARLAPENVDLRLAKYSEFDEGLGRYHIAEHILLPARPVDLVRGVTRRWWLTLRVPDDQPPGDYQARVTVRAPGRPAAELPLTLKVLPFTLREPGVWLGPYYYTPYGTSHRPFRAHPGDDVDAAILRLTEQEFHNLREHGMNVAAMDPEWGLIQYPEGKPTFNEEAWARQDRIWRLYRQILPGPLPAYSSWYGLAYGLPHAPQVEEPESWQPGQDFPADFQALYATAIQMFYERVHTGEAAGHWPEIIYYASDELSNYGSRGGEWGRRHGELLQRIKKQVPGGFRVCASLNGRPEAQLLPFLDIAIPNGAFPITPQTLEDIRQAGGEPWFYNIGWDRFTWGFFLAKTGAKGRLQWHYRTHYQGTPDFFNTLTGGISYGVPVGPDGPCQVGWLEITREGIDDLRYVQTLRALLAEAHGQGGTSVPAPTTKAVAAGEKTLNWILDHIHDLSHYWHEAGYWDNDVYDKLRWQIATDIVALQKAVAGSVKRDT